MTIKSTVLKVLALFIEVCLVLGMSPDTTHAQQRDAIAKEGLIKSLNNKVLSSQELIGQIEQRGVDFRLTDKDEQEIRHAGDYLGKKGLDNLITAVRDNYRPTPLKLQRQPFSPNTEKAIITLGANNIGLSIEALRERPINILRLSGEVMVIAYVKDDKLYADVKINDGKIRPLIELKRNEFFVRPPNWDYNSGSYAFEVVDEKGIPVLQLYYKTPSHIVINGVFPDPKGYVWYLSDTGIFQDEPARYNIKPIFKYPSWKYPNKYIDQ
jgi:hypothetical protein